MTSRSRGAILLCEFGEFRLVQRSKPNLAVPYRKILKLNSNCELDVCSFRGPLVISKLITLLYLVIDYYYCAAALLRGSTAEETR